nr:hypothetical protein [Hahella sp. CCB-MM4]
MKWKFNVHFADFGYAVACHPDKLDSSHLTELRKEIAEKYKLPFHFSVFNAIRLSQYKDKWHTGASADNNEYWEFINELEEMEREA